MSDNQTLAAYEAHVAEYLAADSPELGTSVSQWLEALSVSAARLFEIGSGPGTIAEHLMARGHQVVLSDAAAAFVQHLRSRGHDARTFNILSDPVPTGFDVILAHAVFLHLTRDELAWALPRLRAALTPGGRLAFSVKQGDGDEWSTAKLGAPRYFCYWQPEPLQDLVMASGFASVQTTRWTTPAGQPFLGLLAEAGNEKGTL